MNRINVRFTQDDLIATYLVHPLRGDTILARVREHHSNESAITEHDLANDPLTGITDQNHFGGPEAVCDLAGLAEVSAATKVLDACSGLGGTARVLAATFGCKVDAIEITPQRHRDALHLTEIVGLADAVHHIQGDFLTSPLVDRSYDAILSQSAFSHFADKDTLVTRCAELLKASGCLAFDDACLLQPISSANHVQVTALEKCWVSYLITCDEWHSLLKDHGFVLRAERDLSASYAAHCHRLQELADCAQPGIYQQQERDAYKLASDLCQAKLLGYRRFVATLC